MSVDALSQILDAVRMRGSVYFHTSFAPPWSVRVPAFERVARFHMAMRGDCWLRVEGIDGPIRLKTGDLVVVPHGAAHVLADEPDRPPVEVDEVVRRSGYRGEGALAFGDPDDAEACKLFCGHFEFDESAVHPILGALPNVIHIPNTETMNAHWLESVMRFVFAEISGAKGGSDAIIHRLTEIVFIQVIRSFVDAAGDGAGCFAAILDPKLGKALASVHQSPEKNWTVESLARMAGMSRTVFAERFSELVGLTPVGYLTHWRMQQARRHLTETDRLLIDIAESAGYASEAAFNRAFKRHFGETPGRVRRTRASVSGTV
ncbi:AraC family transcriptional regulator [Nisaea sediminum]|uniref:AraC family transcriptional regulator n=1 Tax=Nisaea sediminum TaxID=2775867 RepID=UPI001865C70B|nr:AraC family transcriptional regulator [Nisaea sediminum]